MRYAVCVVAFFVYICREITLEMTDIKQPNTGGVTHHLNKMYRNWFLDYASYVILERAVPHRRRRQAWSYKQGRQER